MGFVRTKRSISSSDSLPSPIQYLISDSDPVRRPLTALGEHDPLGTPFQNVDLFPSFHLGARFRPFKVFGNVGSDNPSDLRGLESLMGVETDFDCGAQGGVMRTVKETGGFGEWMGRMGWDGMGLAMDDPLG